MFLPVAWDFLQRFVSTKFTVKRSLERELFRVLKFLNLILVQNVYLGTGH